MKAFMNWSGGKDSALCLHKTKEAGIPISSLVTSINNSTDRVSMHGVKISLVEQQAASVKLPLQRLELSEMPSMQVYEDSVAALHLKLKEEGYTTAVYGDIFLEDLKNYRNGLLEKVGLEGLYPLWNINSHELIKEFLSLGYKAIVVCVNGSHLDKSFCGRMLDEDFINDLPGGVDVCGENGEYHSFVFDGPLFSEPVSFSKGEIIYKEYAAPKTVEEECFTIPNAPAGFYFCDLLPV